MAVGEADRNELYRQLERIIGKKPTETMMALLPPVGWADVATKDDLRHESVAVRSDLARESESLRKDIEIVVARMETLESRLNERIMRTALLVNIPSIVAAVGLAFAAARLG